MPHIQCPSRLPRVNSLLNHRGRGARVIEAFPRGGAKMRYASVSGAAAAAVTVSLVSVFILPALLGQVGGGTGNAFAFRWKSGRSLGEPSAKLHLGDLRTLAAILLVAAGAAMSSAGGVGGGGLYVPIFNLLLGFSARTAAVLSNFTIFGGMLANMIWSSLQRDPSDSRRPLVDLDAALAMQPCMLLGISLGVFCNVMFPGWLLTVLLALTLGFVTFRSCRCGMRMWKDESYLRSSCSCDLEQPLIGEIERPHQAQQETQDPAEEQEEPGRDGRCCGFLPLDKLVALLLVWFFFFLVQIVRGSKSTEGYFHLKPCGAGYWLITSSQLPLTLLITMWTLCHFHGRDHGIANDKDKEANKRHLSRSRTLPGMALLAGVLGGLLGIGGGMLINPILMEIGMPPQVTAATSAFMVFFSSSLSVVQYWLMGRIPLDYAVWFSALCFAFSILGLVVVHRAVLRFGHASIIVFTVSSVMGISAVLFVVFGAIDVWRQYRAGEYMGFTPPC